MPGIILRSKARMLRGHDWIYASEILKTYGAPEDGGTVSIKDGRDRLMGTGIYNSRSQIVVRRFTRHRRALDPALLRERVERAWRFRDQLPFADEGQRPCRRFWSESDGLPGVVADQFGPVIVLQTNTLAMDRLKTELAAVFAEQPGVECVIERNDSPARLSEGLPLETGVLLGTPPAKCSFSIAGVTFQFEPLTGQKTGFYLDQIPAYEFVTRFAPDARVLDCFANQGGFALTASAAGAASVTAIEGGAEAFAKLEENITANSLAVQALRSDVFTFLRNAGKKSVRYDLIILDPPSFAKGRGAENEGLRGYRELHLRAARLLAPGGRIASFCCSHAISAERFLDAAQSGFLDAGAEFRILHRFFQPPDHPVMVHLPETEYLKGFFFEEAREVRTPSTPARDNRA